MTYLVWSRTLDLYTVNRHNLLIVRLLYEKRKELSDAANKLKNGLWKIDETREKVQTMSGELEEARANVAVFQKQCEEFLVVIVQQKRDADEQQKVDYYAAAAQEIPRNILFLLLFCFLQLFFC